jgi:amino acid transporter
LERAIDMRGAVAINVITMVGIGPLITIPLVLASLGGALALLGWIGGAIVAFCDGLVWAELSSRFPGTGGTYVYLRETFGHERLGRVLAFLFNWQFLLYAPCILASGYIGFADYAAYLAPPLAGWPTHLTAVAVGLVTILLLLRKTSRVAATGLWLGAAAVLTLALIALAALTHAHWNLAMQVPTHVRFGAGLIAGFASALYITLYDYVGYADVALLGEEVRSPTRTIPRSILLSVVIVAVLYIALQTGVLGVIPWHSLFDSHGAQTPASQYVGSLVIERTWGMIAARIITALILITAFASLYGNLLGMSRIPFAAARDAAFVPAFARLHPRKEIPHIAVIAIGGLSLVASFLSLGQVIAILTAGIVLIQSVLQIFALALLRTRSPAPFRMPLYPLPALIALVGWALAFAYTGPEAIAIGIGWLVVGFVVFLVVARAQRWWPFAAAALACAALFLVQPPRVASAAPVGAWKTWHTSRIVQMNGYPVFEVNGNPFFVWGAPFFYERIPRDEWEDWLRAYRDELHINTIDVYVPWNWQEPTQGDVDFTGRTNPRRDLIGLFRIIHSLGLMVVLRPGPVIRNEWRNGGYPAWLLERPEYNMPLHDVLEGRYPATATLQNQHADAAANEWLHNKTHLRYASQWLRDVLTAVAPYSHDIIAIALDDDQGAYLDNDTWPAPNWHRYIGWLKSVVQSTAGTRVPLFINTYEMKETADSPMWAWGDWYQSDAYSIGEHDRENIDFSTGLLGTQPHVPIMMAEFQAGWLQGADEGAPRPSDPTNTTLALGELLADGVHGIVDFPVQDTINPAGWEAPWANWAYDWDAAFRDSLCAPTESPRFGPTSAFAGRVARWGSIIAASHPAIDVGIIWPPSLFRPRTLDNATIALDADATIAMLQRCSVLGLSCNVVDLMHGYAAGTPHLVLPIPLDSSTRRNLTSEAQSHLQSLAANGRLLPVLKDVHEKILSGSHGEAALLLGDARPYALLVIRNWRNESMTGGPYSVFLASRTFHVSAVRLGERTIRVVPLNVRSPLREGTETIRLCDNFGEDVFRFGTGSEVAANTPGPVSAHRADVFDDGLGAIVLKNRNLFLVFAPDAGARAAAFNRANDGWEQIASTIGLLRDAIDPEPTPSARDYIAAFTHPLPGGTFNRRYKCTILSSRPPVASVTCSYDAPDIPSGGARFERTLSLANDADEIMIHERMIPHDPSSNAHLKSISGFAVNRDDVIMQPTAGSSCFGIYDAQAHQLARLCWRPDDLGSADVRRTRAAAILTLHFKRNDVELRLGVLPAKSESQARGEVAER